MENELNVFVKENTLYIDIRDVAKMVGKRYGDLLRDIRTYVKYLNKLDNCESSNLFVKSSYKASAGKIYPCYLITKKGCGFIINKLTGKKGVIFTALYISAFHAMEDELKKQRDKFMVSSQDYSSALRALADKYDKK